MELEGKLADLLRDTFSPGELRRFLRHVVDAELADELPNADTVSANEYAGRAAEGLLKRGLVTHELLDAWAKKRPKRRHEIMALLADPSDVSTERPSPDASARKTGATLRLFVSYARVDKYRVEELVDILRSGGHAPWFDARLLPGQDWRATLQREVEACDAFVYCLTAASLLSEWCQWEFALAVDQGKPIIPALFDADLELPEPIGRYHYADLTRGPQPRVVAMLMAGLTHIMVNLPNDERVTAPSNPQGYPTYVAWGRKGPDDDTRTLTLDHLVRTDLRSGSRRRVRGTRLNQTDSTSRTIGIDFGTTNSLVAVYEQGRPRVIPNALGYDDTPSAVAVDSAGGIVVGRAALPIALRSPERGVLYPKRLLGTGLTLEVDGHAYDGPTLASRVLAGLRVDAERYLNQRVNSAVVTAPAYFTQNELDDLITATELAGFAWVRVVAEPVAACLTMTIPEDKDGLALVYDLGGGTFDVSILEVGSRVVEAVAVRGDNRLGGAEFDEIVTSYCFEQFARGTGIDLSTVPEARMRTREAVEKAKITLTAASDTVVHVPYITGDSRGARHLEVPLSRARFDELTHHLIERSIDCCKQALADAGKRAGDMHDLVLIGLATLTPGVRRALQRFVGRQAVGDVDPHKAVVLGAARQAGILNGDEKSMLLLNVTAHSLGLELHGGDRGVMIPRNIIIPTRKMELFSTARDNQTSIAIHVVEGEHPHAKDNRSLAQFELAGLPPAPAGAVQIEVMFDLDANNVLTVTAKERATGVSRTVVANRGDLVFEPNLRDFPYLEPLEPEGKGGT